LKKGHLHSNNIEMPTNNDTNADSMGNRRNGMTGNIKDKAMRFALEEIACDKKPPFETVLRKAGQTGLCGIGLPEEHGGAGGGSTEIMDAVRAITRHGGDAGMAFSLSYHLSVLRYLIYAFGDRQQKEAYLRGFATGKITAGLAVSEPGAGAHPKHLKSTAETAGDRYILSGEKSFLTNGPFLDFFIFIAGTAFDGGKKMFTAFLLPANLPDLKKSPLEFGWLKSSPHCTLSVRGCSLSASSILGRPGMAYENIVLPFRVIEDVLLLGLLLGGLEYLFTRLLERARRRDASPEKIGRLFGMLAALDAISARASQALDAQDLPAVGNRVLESLAFEFRNIARDYLSILKTVAGDVTPDEFDTDISRLIDLGRQVTLIRQNKTGDDLLLKGYEYGLESR
jgi:acyl-CoA dehydrogenase